MFKIRVSNGDSQGKNVLLLCRLSQYDTPIHMAVYLTKFGLVNIK